MKASLFYLGVIAGCAMSGKPFMEALAWPIFAVKIIMTGGAQ